MLGLLAGRKLASLASAPLSSDGKKCRTEPSASTSLTPDARATCRAGAGPVKQTSTRRTGSSSGMLVTLGARVPAGHRRNYRTSAYPLS